MLASVCGSRTTWLVALAIGIGLAMASEARAQDSQSALEREIDVRSHRAPLPAAYHEFRVFGANAIYLSHYPMFASIHAYQVIVEVKLAGEGTDAEKAFRDFQAAHPDIHLTLSPARHTSASERRRHDWVLPEEIKVGHKFNADMHWVENPDDFADPTKRRYIATNVTVEITRVVHFRMFYPDSAKPKELIYLAFGKGNENYLAHMLQAYPDFDQIVRAKLSGPLGDTPRLIRLPDRQNTPDGRLKVGDAVAGVFLDDAGRDAGNVRVEAVSEVGFEELEIQK